MTDSTLNIKIDSGKAKRDADSLTKSLDRLEKEGEQTSRSMLKVGADAKKASSGFGFLKTAVISVFSVSALSGFARTIATFQSLENSLEVVFGSMERGKAVFKDIQDLAATTPFSVEALTESVIKLRAAGLEPTNAQLTLFSDTASVTGDALGSLQAITDLFARTTAGGLGLEDLNRLADRGIPVFTILEEKLGLARLEISELGKTAEGAAEILDALTKGLDERFGGASAKAANLLTTTISNMGDAWDRFLKSMGDAGGLSILTGLISGITSGLMFLSENLDLVAVGMAGLSTLAIPALVAGIKSITLAMAANPVGLLVIALTAAAVSVYNFRDVIWEALVKLFEVHIPNAVDRARVKFKEFKIFLDEWIPDLHVNVAAITAQINALEAAMEKRTANYKPPTARLDIEDPLVIRGGGISDGSSLTGDKVGGKGDTGPSDKEKLAFEQKLSLLETSLMTEEDRLITSHTRRQMMLDMALEDKLISEENHLAIQLKMQDKHETELSKLLFKSATAREKFSAMSYKAQTKTVLGELTNMTAGIAQHNKTAFEVNKAASIANAVVNTYEGVSESLSAYPWPLAGVMAAAHLASGMAQVSAIKATSFGGGGAGAIPSETTTTDRQLTYESPLQQTATPEDTGRVINIYIDGALIGDEHVREVIVEAIETAQENDEVRFQVNG